MSFYNSVAYFLLDISFTFNGRGVLGCHTFMASMMVHHLLEISN